MLLFPIWKFISLGMDVAIICVPVQSRVVGILEVRGALSTLSKLFSRLVIRVGLENLLGAAVLLGRNPAGFFLGQR